MGKSQYQQRRELLSAIRDGTISQVKLAYMLEENECEIEELIARIETVFRIRSMKKTHITEFTRNLRHNRLNKDEIETALRVNGVKNVEELKVLIDRWNQQQSLVEEAKKAAEQVPILERLFRYDEIWSEYKDKIDALWNAPIE